MAGAEDDGMSLLDLRRVVARVGIAGATRSRGEIEQASRL